MLLFFNTAKDKKSESPHEFYTTIPVKVDPSRATNQNKEMQ